MLVDLCWSGLGQKSEGVHLSNRFKFPCHAGGTVWVRCRGLEFGVPLFANRFRV